MSKAKKTDKNTATDLKSDSEQEMKDWLEDELDADDDDNEPDSPELFEQTTAVYKSRIINDIILLGISPALAGIALLELSAPLLLLALSEEQVADAFREGVDYVTKPDLAAARNADVESIRKGLISASTATNAVN